MQKLTGIIAEKTLARKAGNIISEASKTSDSITSSLNFSTNSIWGKYVNNCLYASSDLISDFVNGITEDEKRERNFDRHTLPKLFSGSFCKLNSIANQQGISSFFKGSQTQFEPNELVVFKLSEDLKSFIVSSMKLNGNKPQYESQMKISKVLIVDQNGAKLSIEGICELQFDDEKSANEIKDMIDEFFVVKKDIFKSKFDPKNMEMTKRKQRLDEINSRKKEAEELKLKLAQKFSK
eukprot:maker-scaffold_11-snap-gene-8.40-mRNA-1 protein AED:0.00 eAED:0.00 QI:22/1/1/1/1/1/2/82/236